MTLETAETTLVEVETTTLVERMVLVAYLVEVEVEVTTAVEDGHVQVSYSPVAKAEPARAAARARTWNCIFVVFWW